MSLRLLILATYPHQPARHGGQVRLAAIDRIYRAAGFELQHICVYEPEVYPALQGAGAIAFSAEHPMRRYRGRQVPLIADFLTGPYAAADAGAYGAIRRQIAARPDIIHLEQPWLLPLAERLLAEPEFAGTRLIYGSQNIEAPLKRAILSQYQVEAPDVLEEIARLEQRACARADLVLAVSRADQAILSAWSPGRVVLAANGIDPWQASAAARRRWRARLGEAPFALYVASAHPPNLSGFFAMLGASLAFLPPDRCIVTAGSIGAAILADARFRRWEPLNRSRLIDAGIVEDEDLAALKDLAQVFFLPILDGGGTNIKTAEALYSGRYVVGTGASLRGYDSYCDLPGLAIHDEPALFRAAILRALESPRRAAAADTNERRAGLLWQNCLAHLPAEARALLRAGPAQAAMAPAGAEAGRP